MYSQPQFLPAGDVAVSVEFGDEISLKVNTRVRALEYLIQQRKIPGVQEMVPSFRSLLVYYDPLVIKWDDLIARLSELLPQVSSEILPPSRLIEIPCCYGGELGIELVEASERVGLPPGEVVRLHSDAEYLVYFVGFTPGMPYMRSTSDRLTIPRLNTPRLKTPAGSVGIGGSQTCIYPVESPGGFWILGRTPLRLYNPSEPNPILLRAGDRVRFRPIDRDEFDAVAEAVAARKFRIKVKEGRKDDALPRL
jgi:KipI family sensor histidine kinase inhibitor